MLARILFHGFPPIFVGISPLLRNKPIQRHVRTPQFIFKFERRETLAVQLLSA